MRKKEQKYTLTVTEKQLRLISDCLEDCHRFAAGQTELDNTILILDERLELRKKLKDLHPLVTPELSYNSSYGWSGGNCPNDNQRKFIAQTYCIYREILHRLTLFNKKDKDGWSVYESSTLTCDEGGPLPIIEKAKD